MSRKQLFLTYKCIESKFKANNSILNSYKRFNRTDIPTNLKQEQVELMELKKKFILDMAETFETHEIEAIFFYHLQRLTDSEIGDLYCVPAETIIYILEKRDNLKM